MKIHTLFAVALVLTASRAFTQIIGGTLQVGPIYNGTVQTGASNSYEAVASTIQTVLPVGAVGLNVVEFTPAVTIAAPLSPTLGTNYVVLPNLVPTTQDSSSLVKVGAGILFLNPTSPSFDPASFLTANGTLTLSGTVYALTATMPILNAASSTEFVLSQNAAALNIGSGAVASLANTVPSDATPEPTAGALLALTALGLLSKRRRTARP